MPIQPLSLLGHPHPFILGCIFILVKSNSCLRAGPEDHRVDLFIWIYHHLAISGLHEGIEFTRTSCKLAQKSPGNI